MRIIETFIKGKGTPETCEDRVVITPYFVAVLDGATGSMMFDGKPGGWLAAERIQRVIEDLPVNASVEDFLALAQVALHDMATAWDGTRYRACTQAVVYSAYRREIWRIGDCHFAIDGNPYMVDKRVDALTSEMRAAALRAQLRLGQTSVQQLLEQRVLDKLPWLTLIDLQGAYQNLDDPNEPLAYGVLDGTPVPERFVEVYDVKGAKEIVLCSDGFLSPAASLDEALAELEETYKVDPVLIYKHEGTRAFLPGTSNPPQFDDCAYVRVRLHD